MTPAVEDLALVLRLALVTEDRSYDEQAALLRVARMVDDHPRILGCSLENQAVVTWDEDLSGDMVTTCSDDPRPWARAASGVVAGRRRQQDE